MSRIEICSAVLILLLPSLALSSLVGVRLRFDVDESNSFENLRLLGATELHTEGGARGPWETSGYLSVGGEESLGAALFPRYLAHGFDILNLDFNLRISELEGHTRSGFGVHVVPSGDPVTSFETNPDLDAWDERFASVDGIPATSAGLSIGFEERWEAFGENVVGHTANSERCMPPGDACSLLSVRVDGVSVAAVAYPESLADLPAIGFDGSELNGWTKLVIQTTPSRFNRDESLLQIRYQDEVLFDGAIPVLAELRDLVLTTSSDPADPTSYDFDDLTMLMGRHEPHIADFNDDGFVNVNDFVTLTSNMHRMGVAHTAGDIDFDGDVDVYDFAQFRAEYQRFAGTSFQVPEPTALFSLLFGLLALAMWRPPRASYSMS